MDNYILRFLLIALLICGCTNKEQTNLDSVLKIELIYTQPRTKSKTIIVIEDNKLRGNKSSQGSQFNDVQISLSLSEEDIDNLQKLIKDINPCTIPYFYGNLILDDGELIIKYNGCILLYDRDFSRSVVPAGMKEIYKYILFLTWDCDLLPKEYGI